MSGDGNFQTESFRFMNFPIILQLSPIHYSGIALGVEPTMPKCEAGLTKSQLYGMALQDAAQAVVVIDSWSQAPLNRST